MFMRKEKINFKENLKEYWGVLSKYKTVFFTLLIASLITEALWIADRFLFKRIIDDGGLFVNGVLGKEAFISVLIVIAIVYAIIVVTRTITKFFVWNLLIKLDSRMIRDLKTKYFGHILGLSHKFHTTHKTGSLISRIGRGTNAANSMNDIMTFQFLPLIFNLVIVGFSIAYFSMASAITVLGIVIVFVGYSLYIQNKQQRFHLEVNRREDIESGNVGDVFANIDSIKYFGKEKSVSKKIGVLTRKTELANLARGKYYGLFDSGHIFIISLGTFFLLLFPLLSFLEGNITLGTIVFIYTVYGSVAGPLFSFVWGMKGFYKAMGDFQYLFEYGKIENEIKDKPGAKILEIRKGDIEFKDIGFKYGKRNIFEDFNLKVPQNKKIALVGHSGCGKSTLVNLLYRLYDVDEGAVLIDGKNIRDFKQESVRSEMAIVPQECILFDDTIWNNIRFSNPSATKDEVRKAIKFAQLDGIISEMPNKENTIVGERGVKLSGGEKQRVSIARAILANKKILVLDEATSSLDSETEHEIQKDLAKLMEGRTSIIIAHRLSTIMHADKIIVMKKGEIVQMGTHRQLINQQGEYKKLWNLQKGGYIK